MNNVIILNLKTVFLPDIILQDDRNSLFLEKSIKRERDIIPFFDPVAVKEIQSILDKTKAKVVITDNWFWTHEFNITRYWCIKNGLNIDFHENYITPKKMSSERINEVQWWIENNPEDNILCILDESYNMSNLVNSAKQEKEEHELYLQKYSKYMGKKRRKSLIPFLEYSRLEEFTPFYGIEAVKTIKINEKEGLTKEVLEKIYQMTGVI